MNEFAKGWRPGQGKSGSEPRRRNSLRWCDHDYRSAGRYFVTAVTHARACLFGDIVGAEMRVNEAGRMIDAVWQEIPSFYPGVEIDEFVVMPNHLHAIVVLVGSSSDECSSKWDPDTACGARGLGGPLKTQCPAPNPSLFALMQRFKSLTTTRYIHGAKTAHWPRFSGRLWQRSFYDRVIRDEDEWNAFRQYILDNPVRWTIDRENPDGSAGSAPILFEPESS